MLISHRKISILILIFLLVSLVIPPSAVGASAVSLPSNGYSHMISPAPYLNTDGSLDLQAGFSGSFDLSGWDVRLDPKLGPVLQPAAATIGAWSSLGGAGTDLSNTVNTIVIDGGVIYAGGQFINAGGDADADRIAKFSGGAWSSLGGAGTGLGNTVNTIVIDGGVIYAGGQFNNAGGDADADKIAKFSLGAWSSLGGAGTDLSNTVYTIVIDGGVIYAGGQFLNAGGDADADRIAKFSGGAWSSLGGAGTGLSNTVNAIVIDGSVIYAGGQFLNAGGDADRIAKFSGGAWSSLGGAGTDLSNTVNTIVIDGSVIYAGGQFADAGGDADADNIAKFEPTPTTTTTTTTTPTRGIHRFPFDNGGGRFNAGRFLVILPIGIIPSGYSNCRLVVEHEADSNISSGFSTGDAVYDISIQCDPANLTNLTQPITVCFMPDDGVTAGKQVFQRHLKTGPFEALPVVADSSGYVCGTTSQLSLFTLSKLSLPGTGFAPGEVSELASQPEDLAYANAGAITLSIPKLGVELPIVGVPLTPGGWDTSWLNDQAGFLQTTAFPTLTGNTVLTSHVWDADNSPGPFARLKELQHGDQFSIHAWGLEYSYAVRSSRLVSDWNLSAIGHKDYDWVTLLTCEVFNEDSGDYLYRRAVQAVLVGVK